MWGARGARQRSQSDVPGLALRLRCHLALSTSFLMGEMGMLCSLQGCQKEWVRWNVCGISILHQRKRRHAKIVATIIK